MKQKLTIIVALIIIFQNFLFTKEAFPWTEDTHGNLSIHAAENSVLNKNKGDYLKNLGFNKELLEEFTWNSNKRTVKDWIAKGAEFEDKSDWGFPILLGSTTRSFNHFHNPLKPWVQAGLDDFWTGESSLLWAQDGTNQQNFPDGDWSWKKIRDYYYLALTSTTETERQANFAKTFKGLGHQMHLIQDAAQPDHVRNDAHPEDTFSGVITPIGFEKWAGKNKSYINSLASNPIFPSLYLDPSQYTLDSSYYTRNLVPSALFLDTDQYDRLNASAGINQGLAEYTNANFFSDDTIFAAERYPTNDGHYFPYPKKTSTDLQSYIDENKLPEVVIGEDNIPDTSFWIKKERDGESIIEHFVKPEYFTRYINPFISLYYRTFYRDEKCHEDYAQKLIPRAVGYSAGLLDYFFRGDLYITLLVPSTDHVGFDFHNQNDTGSNIDTVAVFIQNNSKLNNVIEPIGTGTLTLTVSYKDSSGTTFYEPAINSISITQIPEIGSASYFAALFTLTSPISTQTAQDITYYFAFRGQLGNETDAVIGKVVKGPVLYNVVPDNGLEGDVVTLTGNNLPIINGPFPIILDDNASDVRFNHDLTPYTTEVINRTNTDITVKVPNTASLKKPGYGGLRVRNVLDTGEKIYSNPISFFPIAEGEVRNTGQTIVNVTIEATKPIVGDYSPLPQTITINNLSPGVSAPIQLITGFTYKAIANTTVTKDIELLTPNVIDFVFEVQ